MDRMADTRDFMFGVVIGGVLGAAAALLYAPQAGTETRVMLKDKATEAKEKTEELAQQAKARAMEMKDQAQARATEVSGQVKAKVGEISTQAQNAVERGKGLVEEQRSALTAAVEAGKQAYTEKRTTLHEEVVQDTEPIPPAITG
jgi:gas vesicle protein